MSSNFDDVGDFHEKFDLPNTTHRPPEQRPTPDDLLDFRVEFLEEELQEFKDARAEGDIAGMFDALLDLTYIAMGTAHVMGFPWQDGWDEVQRANMEKVRAAADGRNSKRLSAYDVVKPDGWKAPDIAGVLQQYGWDL